MEKRNRQHGTGRIRMLAVLYHAVLVNGEAA
uniref:Uncharacterized protein n=1 Tax=Anguilla anguilla TaxID=7936 RepID=A0A0E9TME1_ANGAN